MMPRPLCTGGFDSLPLDPSLGALWLREVLKATLLSYMAKAGAPENLRYSRDTLAPALHFLECMFLTITSGLFAPDATRAGRWTQGVRSVDDAIRFLSGKPAPSQAAGPGPAEAAGADEAVQSDPESPAESIGSAGEAEEAGVSIFALGSDLQVSDDARRSVRCFQHKLSGVIHAARDDQPPDEGEMTEARNQLKRKGWSTFGTFAFCVPGEPGRIAEDVFKTGVATPILGADGDEHHAKLRRLHFEAYALTAAELKRTAESTESDQPRKVPTAELAARYNVLQRRVSPLRLVDRLEPSHSLVNLAAQMLEDQRVRYIEWSKCTSRAQEINLVKEDSSLKVLQGGRTGAVKLVDPGSRLMAETKSDLEVMQALRRRGVAYELAAIMTFERHEELIDRLFMEYQREPMQGFHPVSLAQLQAADREIHVRMGEHTRAGLTPDATGALPLDGPLGKVLSGPHIHWMLMPRQKGSASVGDATEKPPKLPKPPKKTDLSKATDKDSRGDKDQNAGKGSGPNAAEKPTKQRKVRFVMPKALIGGVPRDDSGNNICFDHNLKKCPNVRAAASTPVHDTASSHFGNRSDSNAEKFAAACVGKVDAATILHLLSLLPSEAPSRGSRIQGHGSEFSFTTGAYTFDHGERHGLRQHCREFPHTTKLLNAFMRQQAPTAVYTTLALFRDLETRVHSDKGNDPQQLNTIVKVSNFSDGGLWIADPQGKVPCPLSDEQAHGRVLPFNGQVLSFDAQQPHCVMPWAGGSRVVLVGFTVRNPHGISPGHREELSALGFPLPGRRPDSTAGPESPFKLGVTTALQEPGPTNPVPVGPMRPQAADRNAPPESSGVLRNSGKSIRPSFLEIFCGSAGLSAAVRKLGFQVLGVDHKPTAKHANAPFISLDLRDPEQQERLWVELRRADAVWLAPPCGTSSSARSIPLGNSKHGPKPLRSKEFPDGLPTLADVDRDRVNSANLLYDFTAKVFRFCKSNGILCIVENPVGSLMWRTSWFRSEIPDGFWHELHACMYGSSRRKRTALLATCTLPGLMLQCDGAHKHKRWGRSRDPQTGQWKYATSEETAYPAGFCAAAAREIQLALERVGVCVQPSESTDGAIAATFAQRQPRRGRGVVGPAEYKRLHRIILPRDFQPPECVPADPPPCLVDIPSGSKLLWTRVFVDGGVERREAEFGVYHTPQEFLKEAMATTHPFDSAVSIDGPNLRAIAYTLEHGVAAVKQKRLSVLEHYRALEKSLREDERELKQSMDPAVREVMGSKNLLLFKQMLLDAGVPDEHLFEDMVRGFRLTGPLEPSGLFPPKYKPASISVDELRRTASWSKHLIEAACRKASKDPDVARSVWEESLAQVKKGWLAGPFTWEQMDQKYGGTWVASKRFGVSQGDKVRAVDDLSQFQVNASVTETEKIQLEGLDDIVALARFHLGSTVAGTKVFRLPMSGGGVYQGRLHRDFRDGRARNLKGRALDLRSAYKQLARHPSDDWASVLGVLDPDTGTVSYFESAALPFGASSAVTGFNRAARALRIIMSRLLLLVNTSFFDDFCQLEIDGLTDSADQAALALLDLLGWEVSDGDKLKPFASEFTMLGAVLSFKDAGRGLIRIRNKPGRVEEIGDMVERLASDPGEGARSLPSLKGKLLFAASHVFGRCAQVATQLIHHAEKHQGSGAHACVEAAVRRALDTLKAAGDRQVNLWSEQPPVIVFTDGACEERGSQVTHGAVIVDVASQTYEVFGGHIPGPLVEVWRGSGRVQLIFFAELYPVLIARRTWGKVLRNRRALFFVDNEAAKAALIRNYSPLVDAANMLADIAELDVVNHCFPWYCRVPSKSNFSDAASRLSFGEYEERFRKVQPMIEAA
ncbi:unnamed protein product [Symbiodinium sp. CCMP2592]|nr:unnamed protein product [Symbiodinium sp. CCMP2592]